MPSRRLEQPIVAVAEDLACVDMVDGRLIENLHVDDGRRVLAWADAITEHATHRLTLYGGKPMERLIGRSARAAVGARSGGDE